MECVINEVRFKDTDVVNPEEYCINYNPHKNQLFILHDHGFVVCVVIASNLQDALDIAVDNNQLDRYQLSETELADYTEDEIENLTCLGNASEFFDIESLGVIEQPLPPFSICALFNAMG